MIPQGLFTQIGMIIVSIGILFTYVQPTLQETSAVQDDIVVYQTKIENVAEVNNTLNNLVSNLESVSNEDRQRLLTYMPDTVDKIAVPRDLLLMANEAGVLYTNSSYMSERDRSSSNGDNGNSNENTPTAHELEFQVEGTYGQIKELFQLMQLNDYPLEVYNANIERTSGGFLEVNMTLRTYSYYNPTLDQTVEF